MFNGGVRPFSSSYSGFPVAPSDLTSFVGAFEQRDGFAGETIMSALGNSLNDRRRYRIVMAEFGVNGFDYARLARGTQSYNNILAAAAAAVQIAGADHFVVRAITATHGEADLTNPNYEEDLLTWRQDFDADLKAITGQRQSVLMFIDQVSSWTAFGLATADAPIAQYNAALVDKRSDIVMVGPKYQYGYYSDGQHLVDPGYEHLGEKYAEAYYLTVIREHPWKPIYPERITIRKNVITALFNVPFRPLVVDTTSVSDPGNAGFEYGDDSNPPSITRVSARGSRVMVTLSSVPTAAEGNRHLRYAFTGTPGNLSGPTSGARGCLRDSDPLLSRYDGSHLWNWAITFDRAF
jgi:hypothetical protein